MGSFSITHWLVIVLVIAIFFGGKKIPELAKGIGQGIKEFKKAAVEEKEELNAMEKEMPMVTLATEKK